MSRPRCVVNVRDVTAEKRPRVTPARPGRGAMVRNLGDTAGLTRMGVWLREIAPGDAGTNRHFHTVEEEWAYVVAGRGTVRIGPHRLPVEPGDLVAFPPGPRPHHFIAAPDATLVILEGGERRRAEDSGRYVDIDLGWQAGRLLETTERPPPEEGDPEQLVRTALVEPIDFHHPVDPRAFRSMHLLSARTTLERQVVNVARIEPGARSTALHTHDRTDEWVLILDGRATVTVGDATFDVGPHDFVAHPAGSAPHRMEAIEPTTYLVGGQRDPDDVVTYPEARVRLVRGALEPLPE